MSKVEDEMDDSAERKRDWVDVALKIFTPIITGLLIAWAGFVSNYTLTDISNKEQSARLITELQISREKAESDLRKDVFDQALQAFLLKNQEPDHSLFGMSKQLLRLELLSLNFGDSLSLSPLFTEYREDLKRLEPKPDEIPIFEESKGELRKRLYSLARRVSSAQLSSLGQHGAVKNISIPLYQYSENAALPCNRLLFENSYIWPDSELQRDFEIYNEDYQLMMSDDELQAFFTEASDDYHTLLQDARLLELDGVERFLEVRVSDVDHCGKSAKVSVYVYRKKPITDNAGEAEEKDAIFSLGQLNTAANEGLEIEVSRSFNLNYFNFPMVDNTRLSNNHRFSIVLEAFDLKGDEPHIELTGLVFPSEYASLRDRPGMQEARELLEEALASNEPPEE